MKLEIRIPERYQQLARSPSALFPLVSILVVCAYLVYLALFLYGTLYLTIIVPKPVDQQQITAHQEKVNRQQLNAVKAFDDTKRSAEVPASVKNPF